MNVNTYLIDLRDLYINFHKTVCERLSRATLYSNGHTHTERLRILVDDFYDIAVHRASDAVHLMADAGEQRRLLNPMGLRQMRITGQMQDVFFEEFHDYARECSYFDESELDTYFYDADVASVCVFLVEQILSKIMATLVQMPDGRLFFGPTGATVYEIISEMIISPIPNRLDVRVQVEFE